MRTNNIDLERSEAVIAWNDHGLAGYAVHKGDIWSCVTATHSVPATHIFRHGDAAIRWLHENGDANFFESLSDRRDLRPLLEGVRGQPRADVDALIRSIVSLSWLAIDLGDHLEALDANPIMCGPDGCVAVDALVIPSSPSSTGQLETWRSAGTPRG